MVNAIKKDLGEILICFSLALLAGVGIIGSAYIATVNRFGFY